MLRIDLSGTGFQSKNRIIIVLCVSCTIPLFLSSAAFHAGSMAFMRAVHEDPPIKPIFSNYYHLQSDELLGSWLILLANIPIIPYCIIYLSTATHNMEYLGALAMAILIVVGASLFVMCCYPSDRVSLRVV